MYPYPVAAALARLGLFDRYPPRDPTFRAMVMTELLRRPLSTREILAWASAHREATGHRPTPGLRRHGVRLRTVPQPVELTPPHRGRRAGRPYDLLRPPCP